VKVVVFCQSLASCWNHGNAHFLRGIVSELLVRGNEVVVYEPADGWSAANLTRDHGRAALRAFKEAYPRLCSRMYLPTDIDLDDAIEDADVVLVHEWNDPELVSAVGRHRITRGGYRLLFHDTHHRSVTAPHEMERYDLSNYDGVLAFGEVIRNLYLKNGWAKAAWTWHEAADPRVFRPKPKVPPQGDLVWIGNWGDGERAEELTEFLLRPVKELGIRATVYGVRYPEHAVQALRDAGITYGGWLPNHEAPNVFARHRVTVHVPRRPYVQHLPGIPTIRPFEAMACGIPLVCAPWNDAEGLFNGDRDYVTARDGEEMKAAIRRVLDRPDEALARAEHALQTVLERHCCSHRVDQLEEILEQCPMRKAVAL
jgi:spore maturation protein CgeB